MKILIFTLFLALTTHAYAFSNDEACKLYLCLMGKSEADGGSECMITIKNYTNKFQNSCPDLPTCTGTAGPKTSGALMITVKGSGGSTQHPENGKISQVCVEEDTPYGTFCEIALNAPATNAFGSNYASCGGS